MPRAEVATSLALGSFLFAAMPVAPRMTPAERAIARDMHSRGLTPAHIAKQLGRNRSSITRLLAQGGQDPRHGRPPATSEGDSARATRVLGDMVAEAKGQRGVIWETQRGLPPALSF